MPETPEKLPLIPRQMPKWFWPLVLVVCVSATAFASTLCLTVLTRRHSEPVQMALKIIAADPRIAGLGQPLKPGWLVLGDSKTINGTERCYWQFKAVAPGGECVVKMDALRPAGGAWQVDYLQTFIVGSDADWITLIGDKDHPPENFNPPAKPEPAKDTRPDAAGKDAPGTPAAPEKQGAAK